MPAKRLSFIEPMAAKLVNALPEGPKWVYEVKLDGYRVLAFKDGDSVRLISRNNKDLTSDFTHVARNVATVKAKACLLDGEIVAVDAQGIPRFQMLQHRSQTSKGQIVYYAFDLLSFEGKDLIGLPLKDRKAKLSAVAKGSNVLLSELLPGPPESLIEAARAMKLEGVIAKRIDSKYEPGQRSGAWQKLRLNVSQEFVVGGYSHGSPFDGILVGYYQSKKLMFCARVRAGFTPSARREVWARIKDTHVASCPFENLPMGKSGGWNEGVGADEMKAMKWVKPTLVVQVAFVEWTDYGLLRHSSFAGFRDDKHPHDVLREDV